MPCVPGCPREAANTKSDVPSVKQENFFPNRFSQKRFWNRRTVFIILAYCKSLAARRWECGNLGTKSIEFRTRAGTVQMQYRALNDCVREGNACLDALRFGRGGENNS